MIVVKHTTLASRLLLAMGGFLMLAACDALDPHSPERAIALGYVRPITCAYQGHFLGGDGYDCVVKNLGEHMREVKFACASYDDQNRQIGSTERSGSLYHEVLQPGEERIARLYWHEKSALGICSDIGEVPPLAEVLPKLDDWRAKNLGGEITLK